MKRRLKQCVRVAVAGGVGVGEAHVEAAAVQHIAVGDERRASVRRGDESDDDDAVPLVGRLDRLDLTESSEHAAQFRL